MMIYNRPYTVPAWVILKCSEEKSSIIRKALEENGAKYIQWPSHTFMETINEMKKSGWHNHLKEYPYLVSPSALESAMANHIKKTAILASLAPQRRYEIVLNRNVKSDKDMESLFNEALSLEDDITLSYIFGTGESKSKIYISDSPVNLGIIRRLAGKVLTIGEKDDTINIKKVEIEKLGEYVIEAIAKELGLVTK